MEPSTGKLVLLTTGWILASGAIALSVAVLLTELLGVFGVVDRSGSGYGVSLRILTVAIFVVLATVPFVFRARFRADTEDPS
ncbi:MAG: hypothetical protein KDB69_09115 [Acidimicrobiia bacterium]|nr:hypothetical protein [Acidimicrobiia bacterium]